MNESIKNCISNANDFYDITCDIDKRRLDFQYKYMSVLATNLSFACELYFKAILIKENKKVSGHSLIKLYNRLNMSTKRLLESEFNNKMIMHNLLETLTNCDNVFVDFRYLHESNKNKKLYITDLGILVNSLRTICNDYFSLNIK